jgi:predicted DCC family thiol-disulfide oxidoreductase YuxK
MPANRRRDHIGVQAPYAIVLFDGVCGLCNRSIDFLLRHDRHGALRFAPLQSQAGQALLRQHGLNPAEFSSVVVIDGSQVHRRSDAALHALSRLGAFWGAIAIVARVLPRSGRDAIYDWVAKNRYRWFGRQSSCRIPAPDERQRFLPD